MHVSSIRQQELICDEIKKAGAELSELLWKAFVGKGGM